jgi:hypothetical protein
MDVAKLRRTFCLYLDENAAPRSRLDACHAPDYPATARGLSTEIVSQEIVSQEISRNAARVKLNVLANTWKILSCLCSTIASHQF